MTVPDIPVLPLRRFFACLALLMLLSGCASSPDTHSYDDARSEKPAPVRDIAPLTPAQQQLLSQARSATENQQWDAAEAALQQLLAQRPDAAVAHSRMGWVVQQQGDRQRAMALYREAIERDPRDALTVNNLALLLMEDRQFGEAAKLLRDGLRYSPQVPELHYNLAVVSELYLLDLKTALRHYRRYRDLTGDEDKAVAGWIADLERRLD